MRYLPKFFLLVLFLYIFLAPSGSKLEAKDTMLKTKPATPYGGGKSSGAGNSFWQSMLNVFSKQNKESKPSELPDSSANLTGDYKKEHEANSNKKPYTKTSPQESNREISVNGHLAKKNNASVPSTKIKPQRPYGSVYLKPSTGSTGRNGKKVSGERGVEAKKTRVKPLKPYTNGHSTGFFSGGIF